MLQLRCPHCYRIVLARRQAAGQPMACPRCSKLFMVPDPAATTLRAQAPAKPTDMDMPAACTAEEPAEPSFSRERLSRVGLGNQDLASVMNTWFPAPGVVFLGGAMFLGFLGLVVILVRNGNGLGLALASACLSVMAFLMLLLVSGHS